MNLDQFWVTIDQSREGFQADQATGNMDRQVEALDRLLSHLSPDEVLAFRDIRDELLAKAYTWELWGAAYILGNGYCSDDWFLYFRAWLISMGRQVFETAIADPDSLASSAYTPGIEDIFFERFLYVPTDVLKKTVREVPKSRMRWPDSPSGQKWEEPDKLKLLLPKLWERQNN